MELGDVDLNLLVVFRQLLVERRVSKVAETLGLTQPAVSNALSRLRRALGDELFLRTPSGMEPTAYAKQLAEPVTGALQTLHVALNERSTFDPSGSARSFTVGMTDIGEIYFLPQLLRRLREQAPSVVLSTVRNTAVNLQDELESGQVDLAIGLLPQLRGAFFQRKLFGQRYVCLHRRGHPLDHGRLSLDEFLAADHLVVESAGTGHGRVETLFKRRGLRRRVRLTVPHFIGVGHILQQSDLLATVPQRLAEQLVGPFGLVFVDHPVEMPEVDIKVFWHAKFHRAPANEWLRTLVFEVFGVPESKPRVRASQRSGRA